MSSDYRIRRWRTQRRTDATAQQSVKALLMLSVRAGRCFQRCEPSVDDDEEGNDEKSLELLVGSPRSSTRRTPPPLFRRLRMT